MSGRHCRVVYALLGLHIVPQWSSYTPDSDVDTLRAFSKHLITTSGIFFQNWLAVGVPLQLKWHLPLQLATSMLYCTRLPGKVCWLFVRFVGMMHKLVPCQQIICVSIQADTSMMHPVDEHVYSQHTGLGCGSRMHRQWCVCMGNDDPAAASPLATGSPQQQH